MTPPIVISIDWDFFLWRGSESKERWITVFPGTPKECQTHAWQLYDWGHSEAWPPAMQAVLWATRYDGFKRCGLDPIAMTGIRAELGCVQPEAFLRALWDRFGFDDASVHFADSHALGYVSAAEAFAFEGRRPVRVVHFDAHADMGYENSSVKAERRAKTCDCGSWLYHALHDRLVSHVDLIYPDWRDDVDLEGAIAGKHMRSHLGQVTPYRWSDWVRATAGKNLGRVALTTIARSSAWTPPWFDAAFDAFVCSVPGFGEPICLDCELESTPGGHDACAPRDWKPASLLFPWPPVLSRMEEK